MRTHAPIRSRALAAILGSTLVLSLAVPAAAHAEGVADDSAITPIAEIQGTGSTTPLAGQTVTTRGIVTAAYPEGGFRGFYLQTAGTGADVDPSTHPASDALFVFMNNVPVTVEVGDYVEVTGTAGEFPANAAGSLTQIAAAGGTVTVLNEEAAPVTPAAIEIPGSDAERERLEGMLLEPVGPYTVTNTYQLNTFAEIGLALGETPLITPTETELPGTDAWEAQVAENQARLITLDDGASQNFTAGARNTPLPYLTDQEISVGATATLNAPVVLDYRFDLWRLQPQATVVAGGPSPVTFGPSREAEPRDVGGDVAIASFNVLNYFTTTGERFTQDTGISCTYYNDRAGTPVTVNRCGDAGPRGAANAASLERQEEKIVAAINGLGADVVSLEEIENSARFDRDRDDALRTLVDALNADAGAGTWEYVPSPEESALPPIEDQDVIRTAFIYKPEAATPVGSSVVLDDPAFDNAREPLAQAFAAPGESSADFVAIVNHFKSKGSGEGEDADQGDGQGAGNVSRIAQAEALVGFADEVADAAETERVFLLGDFNAYSMEDPIRVFTDAGYVQLTSEGEYSYSFSGQSGSLDHVFASPAAVESVIDVDIWRINAGESIALEYSRFNNNATPFHEPDAFRSSDHDPLIVGVEYGASETTTLNLLNVNDYHGRIERSSSGVTNAVQFAGTVEQLRAQYGDDATLFLSAGDNIGASQFASALADDEPTIELLNALELAASAVGNHEFDKGYDDLVGRVTDSADFPYLGANVYVEGTTEPALEEYALLPVGDLTVAVIGAVTQETPSLVSPAFTEGLDFGDPVDAVNRVAAEIESEQLADVIIAQYHEGAAAGSSASTLEAEVAKGGAFAKIVTETAPSVDAIFTGHTHAVYAWSAPVGDDGATRPIVQAGSYGDNVGQVVLTVDNATGEVTAASSGIVPRTTTAEADLLAAFPRVAAVKEITDAALAEAEIIGARPVGSVTDDITRAFSNGTFVDGRYQGGTSENRAGTSAVGNLVADAVVDTLADPLLGGAEIGVVNPGGLRADIAAGEVTYAEANAVLPFVNNLWTTTLTGAQFVAVLEQQWQPEGASRPYLQLGLSENVQYTFDAAAPAGERITGVWIDGVPLDPAEEYRIGSFSFLLQGGDNFTVFADGTDTRDSGLVDRDGWIAYLEANPGIEPDFRSPGVPVAGGPTEPVSIGDEVTVEIPRTGPTAALPPYAGIDLTSNGSPANGAFEVSLTGSDEVFPDAAITQGGASVSLTVPADAPAATEIVLEAPDSGTVVRIPLAVEDATVPPVTPPGEGGETPTPPVTPPGEGGETPTPPGEGGETPPVTVGPPAGLPTPPSLSDLDPELRGAIGIAGTDVEAGEQVRIFVGLDYVGQWVHAYLYSEPLSLGWHQVEDDGYITVTLPRGLSAGDHTIVVQNAAGEVIGWERVQVAALPATGSTSPLGAAALAMLALALGTGLIGVARRGRRRDEASAA